MSLCLEGIVNTGVDHSLPGVSVGGYGGNDHCSVAMSSPTSGHWGASWLGTLVSNEVRPAINLSTSAVLGKLSLLPIMYVGYL